MSIRIEIEVVEYGAGQGPYVAGMAIVRVNGATYAKLRTQEKYEITVHEPDFTTKNIDLNRQQQ